MLFTCCVAAEQRVPFATGICGLAESKQAAVAKQVQF